MSPKPQETIKCQYCGSTEEILPVTPIWSPWGRNAFDFHWCKYDDVEYLCEACEGEKYCLCSECGAAVDAYHYGTGYLPDDYDGDYLCPECAEKKGFEITVGINCP